MPGLKKEVMRSRTTWKYLGILSAYTSLKEQRRQKVDSSGCVVETEANPAQKQKHLHLVVLWSCQGQKHCESRQELMGQLSVAADSIFSCASLTHTVCGTAGFFVADCVVLPGQI